MRILLSIVIIGIICAGCNTSRRSISHYQYGYNPSYQGEMSEIEFIKDVSEKSVSGKGEPIRLAVKERVILIQSGQVRPDGSFLGPLGSACTVIPMSGIPSRHAVGESNLRTAARAGGVTKIVAYWGSIEAKSKQELTTAVAWVPVVGWFIPNETQKMRISVSAIIADVKTGQWSHVTSHSSETKILSSLFTRYGKDSEQVETLKAEAYGKLVKKLVSQ